MGFVHYDTVSQEKGKGRGHGPKLNPITSIPIFLVQRDCVVMSLRGVKRPKQSRSPLKIQRLPRSLRSLAMTSGHCDYSLKGKEAQGPEPYQKKNFA